MMTRRVAGGGWKGSLRARSQQSENMALKEMTQPCLTPPACHLFGAALKEMIKLIKLNYI